MSYDARDRYYEKSGTDSMVEKQTDIREIISDVNKSLDDSHYNKSKSTSKIIGYVKKRNR